MKISTAAAISTESIMTTTRRVLIVTELKKQRQPRLPSVVSSTSSEASASATSWTRQQQQQSARIIKVRETTSLISHLSVSHHQYHLYQYHSISMFINIRVDTSIMDLHQRPPSGNYECCDGDDGDGGDDYADDVASSSTPS